MASTPRYIIPDTCAFAASLYNEPYSANADPLLTAIRSGSVEAIAPSVCLTEFLNVSRKKHEPDRAGVVALPVTEVEAVVIDFLTLPVLWIDSDPATALNAWHLHQHHQLQTADAIFAEVARQWQAGDLKAIAFS